MYPFSAIGHRGILREGAPVRAVWQDAKFFVDLPAANSQILAFLNVEAAPNTGLGKGFEKFASANFLEESINRSLRLGGLGEKYAKRILANSKFTILRAPEREGRKEFRKK